jgi:hypothetical protein
MHGAADDCGTFLGDLLQGFDESGGFVAVIKRRRRPFNTIGRALLTIQKILNLV